MVNVFSLAYFRSKYSGYESDRAGEAQGRFFQNFVNANIRSFHAAWPGWEMKWHVDDRMAADPTGELLGKYSKEGLARLVFVGPAKTLCGSMLWRLYPLFEEGVDWVVCRDVDSLPMHRDRLMVEKAIAIDASMHGLNDSESHSIPMMGGMIAVNAKKFRQKFPGINSLEQLMRLGDPLQLDYNVHGTDQQFLNAVLWPRLRDEAVIHTRSQYNNYDCRTFVALPQVTELDKVIRHVGAAYPVPEAIAAAEKCLSPEMLERIRSCER